MRENESVRIGYDCTCGTSLIIFVLNGCECNNSLCAERAHSTYFQPPTAQAVLGPKAGLKQTLKDKFLFRVYY